MSAIHLMVETAAATTAGATEMAAAAERRRLGRAEGTRQGRRRRRRRRADVRTADDDGHPEHFFKLRISCGLYEPSAMALDVRHMQLPTRPPQAPAAGAMINSVNLAGGRGG